MTTSPFRTVAPNTDTPLGREAQAARRALGDDLGKRRAEAPVQKPIDNRSKEEKMTDEATVDQERAIISADSGYDVFRVAVWAGYGNHPSFNQFHLKTLTNIAYSHGLNPFPGLDLIYMYVQEKTGRVVIQVSYKGWLAIAKRLKRFRHSVRRLSDSEAVARGNESGDIVYIAEAIDIDAMQEMIAVVKELREAGDETATIQDYKDFYIVTGNGVCKKSETPPKGRDREWVAKKRCEKDLAMQLCYEHFNARTPVTEGATYDHEEENWTMPVVAKSNGIIEGVVEPIESPAVEPAPQPEPPAKPVKTTLARNTLSGILDALMQEVWASDYPAALQNWLETKGRKSLKDCPDSELADAIKEFEIKAAAKAAPATEVGLPFGGVE